MVFSPSKNYNFQKHVKFSENITLGEEVAFTNLDPIATES